MVTKYGLVVGCWLPISSIHFLTIVSPVLSMPQCSLNAATEYLRSQEHDVQLENDNPKRESWDKAQMWNGKSLLNSQLARFRTAHLG